MVNLAQDIARPFVLDADDDTVRLFKVFDRRALAQELGVGSDAESVSRHALGYDALDLVACADPNGRLDDDNREVIIHASDGPRSVMNVTEIR